MHPIICGLVLESFPFKVADVPGVIKILDWFESTESFFIVMEKFVGQVNITSIILNILLSIASLSFPTNIPLLTR